MAVVFNLFKDLLDKTSILQENWTRLVSYTQSINNDQRYCDPTEIPKQKWLSGVKVHTEKCSIMARSGNIVLRQSDKSFLWATFVFDYNNKIHKALHVSHFDKEGNWIDGKVMGMNPKTTKMEKIDDTDAMVAKQASKEIIEDPDFNWHSILYHK